MVRNYTPTTDRGPYVQKHEPTRMQVRNFLRRAAGTRKGQRQEAYLGRERHTWTRAVELAQPGDVVIINGMHISVPETRELILDAMRHRDMMGQYIN